MEVSTSPSPQAEADVVAGIACILLLEISLLKHFDSLVVPCVSSFHVDDRANFGCVRVSCNSQAVWQRYRCCEQLNQASRGMGVFFGGMLCTDTSTTTSTITSTTTTRTTASTSTATAAAATTTTTTITTTAPVPPPPPAPAPPPHQQQIALMAMSSILPMRIAKMVQIYCC